MKRLFTILIFLFIFNISFAQDNYEIQVYGSQTQAKGTTMFELHSNFTFNGQKNILDGVRPSNHALHETLEITQGITDNFEIGFYFFTNYTSPYGYKYVGSHIRPRIQVPEKWNWPVGVSLSTEFGFQSSDYSDQTWSIEIRPIIDKQFKKLYLSFNPTFGIGLKGTPDHTPSFEPNIKGSYSFNKVALGLEYYGSLGPIDNIPELSQQNHAIFVAADLNIDPKWEINFGPGWGLTQATDAFVFKVIIGRRINWKKSENK
ncbi:MAG: hypothetical protein ABI185_08780 [Ginsengibacter sp.]